MALLPSGYITCTKVEGAYDSGILTASDLEIEALFNAGVLTTTYFFGGRNSSSTSSAGQLNVSNTYFGCAGARTALDYALTGISGYIHFHVLNNYLEAVSVNKLSTATGSTTSFTGTRNIYINGLNNAGSLTESTVSSVCGFIIKKDGSLVADFIPCYDETNQVYGLYDLVSEAFFLNIGTNTSSLYTLNVAYTSGGVAYAKTFHDDKVNVIMCDYITSATTADYVGDVHLVAQAKDGYVFKGWRSSLTNKIISTEEEYDFTPSQDNMTLTAVFVKNSKMVLNENFFAKIKSYDNNTNYFATVLSASINEDSLQKTTSTITLKELPSGAGEKCVICLYDPKAKLRYIGIIQTIEDTVLTCRELLSFYDMDYLFSTSTFSSSNFLATYGLEYLMTYGGWSRSFDSTNVDNLLYRWISQNVWVELAQTWLQTEKLSLYHQKNCNVLIPAITETGIENFEDYIISFASYGIYIKAYENNSYIFLKPYYFKNNDTLKLGNNLEAISDISITQEAQESNVLVLYNTSGTLRGMYGINNDGDVEQYNVTGVDLTTFEGYSNYSGSVVMSDDNLKTLLQEKLSASALNHKITFDVAFGDMLTLDMFKVGTPVDFYYYDKVYHSVITGRKFDVVENQEQINTAQITLGNVRTNLTSKLNLKKTK